MQTYDHALEVSHWKEVAAVVLYDDPASADVDLGILELVTDLRAMRVTRQTATARRAQAQPKRNATARASQGRAKGESRVSRADRGRWRRRRRRVVGVGERKHIERRKRGGLSFVLCCGAKDGTGAGLGMPGGEMGRAGAENDRREDIEATGEARRERERGVLLTS